MSWGLPGLKRTGVSLLSPQTRAHACAHGRGLGRQEALLCQAAPAHVHAHMRVSVCDGCAPCSYCRLKCVRSLSAHTRPGASAAPSQEALGAPSGPGDPISRAAPRPYSPPAWEGLVWAAPLGQGGQSGHHSRKAPSRASSSSPATHSRGPCRPGEPGTETQVWQSFVPRGSRHQHPWWHVLPAGCEASRGPTSKPKATGQGGPPIPPRPWGRSKLDGLLRHSRSQNTWEQPAWAHLRLQGAGVGGWRRPSRGFPWLSTLPSCPPHPHPRPLVGGARAQEAALGYEEP